MIFVPVDALRDFIVFTIIMMVITVCFLMTNLYYSNPLLAALGYHLYTIKTFSTNIPDGSVAIYHGNLKINQQVYYYHIADDVYYLI